MSRDFKKTFFSSLLAVLLVVSNLIGLKLTNFLDLIISVDFLTYPFTFLCTLLIFNLAGKKSAYQSVLVSAFIQIFITISYTLAVNLGNQALIPDLASSVNEVFQVKELNLLASLFSFLVSHYILIYIYDNLKKFGKELYGVVIGLLGSLFSYAAIYLIITLYGNDILFIANMFLSNIIISLILLVIMTILFYILKEKESGEVIISNMHINTSTFKSLDKAIDEVMTESKEKPKKKVTKKTPNKSGNSKKSNISKTNKKKINKSNSTTKSQKKVNNASKK